jgi:hypothetical protein
VLADDGLRARMAAAARARAVVEFDTGVLLGRIETIIAVACRAPA